MYVCVSCRTNKIDQTISFDESVTSEQPNAVLPLSRQPHNAALFTGGFVDRLRSTHLYLMGSGKTSKYTLHNYGKSSF